MSASIRTRAETLGLRLKARHETVATAESCTGGLIAGALTDIAGSSDWFGWGVVSYANAAKTGMLKVSPASLAAHGAVSEVVAAEMARGVQKLSGADWSVAVSGVAGPGGGTPDKPVGLVCFAIAMPFGRVDTFVRHFTGDRRAVRTQTVEVALDALLERVNATRAGQEG